MCISHNNFLSHSPNGPGTTKRKSTDNSLEPVDKRLKGYLIKLKYTPEYIPINVLRIGASDGHVST